MRLRALLLFFAFWFLAVSTLSAQHSPDPTQARLAIVAHLAALTQSDFKTLSAQAQSGDPEAQSCLGQMYEDGEGVEQNYALAAEWYRKAAEHVPDLGGAGQGRNSLGLLYMQGLGVPKEYLQAYMWFALAHCEGNLKQVQSEMTPAQILHAQHMVEEWKKQHPTP